MKPTRLRPISACTSNPNTPASDLLPAVDHDVTVVRPDGRQEVVRLCAACPMTAMDLIHAMDMAEFNALPRVPNR